MSYAKTGSGRLHSEREAVMETNYEIAVQPRLADGDSPRLRHREKMKATTKKERKFNFFRFHLAERRSDLKLIASISSPNNGSSHAYNVELSS